MPARAARSSTVHLDLPPGFTLVRLRERGDALAEACRLAPTAGAGTFVHVGRFDVLEFAVVLEPEEPLSGARRAFYAGMTALADAVAAYAPPEKPIRFDWPDAVRLDEALVGGARLAWPPDCPEDAVPDWLVFSGLITASLRRLGDPGLYPDATSLEEEDVENGQAVIESFARHLMLAFRAWADDGFGAIEAAYLGRMAKERAGDIVRLSPSGDLLMSNEARRDVVERRLLLPALESSTWLDRDRAAPRLDGKAGLAAGPG
jgi:hypothetical protein